MTHKQKAENAVLARMARDGEVFDPSIITLIMDAVQQFIAMCQGTRSIPPRPPENLAQRSKFPTEQDDIDHFNAVWQKTKQNISNKKVKDSVTGQVKRNTPSGKKLKPRDLKAVREEYAAKIFWARKDEAAVTPIEDLVEMYRELQTEQINERITEEFVENLEAPEPIPLADDGSFVQTKVEVILLPGQDADKFNQWWLAEGLDLWTEHNRGGE